MLNNRVVNLPASAEVQQLIAEHPCFNRQAHQFARMHLAVAPACNIQCHYCNRKFDCSNESRPGVVSQLLSPVAAAQRFTQVKQRVPETRVVGIAGPGDPLANPKATFASLKAIAKADPSVHLCISTNGLMLPQYVDELVNLGVKHLTITINAIDAEIGAQIYPWVFFEHKRWRGKEGAQRLIAQQQKGLQAAIDAGMLVKVNTVLIPGINDAHIAVLAKHLAQYGAFVHNIMPLISAAEHGTYFGITGQPQPSEAQLSAARSQAGQDIDQMVHCQQCRADAVGKLGEDQSVSGNEPTPSSMLVAIASQSEQLIDQHFGHAKRFLRYCVSADNIEALAPLEVDAYCSGEDVCEEAEQRIDERVALLADCQLLLCSRIGYGPKQALIDSGLKVDTQYAIREIDAALQAIQQGLRLSKRTCSSGECG